MKYKLGDKVYLKGVITSINSCAEINYPYEVKTADEFVAAAEQHLEPINKSELGHAEEAPLCLRNVLARLRELPEHDRKVWMDGIMHEFANDYGSVKYTLGYEQGKFDGAVEAEKSNKVVIPQFVAEWIKKCKTFKNFAVSLSFALQPSVWEANRLSDECIEWLTDAENQDIFARAWLDGYEVEKERRYFVKIRATKHCFAKDGNGKIFFSLAYKGCFTKKELEDADFGWVFDCEGIEIEEVEDDTKI